MNHMQRHHGIATRYLSLFWLPGNRELQQWAPTAVEPVGDGDENPPAR